MAAMTRSIYVACKKTRDLLRVLQFCSVPFDCADSWELGGLFRC